MRLTSSRLAAVVAEASAALASRHVRRVRERSADCAVLETSAGDLVVSWHPRTARLLVAGSGGPTVVAESPFVQKLRADVEGAGLIPITAVPNDRVAEATFERTDDAGTLRRRLVIEAFGPRSNAFLLADDGTVVAIARPRVCRGRDVGSPYVAPPPPPPPSPSATVSVPGPPEIEEPLDAPRIAKSPWPRSHDLETEAAAEEVQEERESRRAAAARAARAAEQRLVSRRRALEHDLEEAILAPRYSLFGELLRASFAKIPRGAREVSLVDYSDPEARPVAIPLDPTVPPAENIRRYFQKAKKGSGGEPVIRKQLAAVGERLAALEAAAAALESIESDAALDAAIESLSALGVVPAERPASGPSSPKKSRTHERRAERLPYRSFVSAEGFPILVGRGARENDQLTLRFARGNDLWLHVSGGPGSHVVVRVPSDKSVPLETLLDAAALAAHYSPRRGRSGVEVVYTPAKNIRKPRGAAPGLVTFAGGKVIKSGHDAARLKRLLGGDETAP